MAQGLLAFKYEEERKTTGMTALAGLPVYLELAEKMGFGALIEKHLRVRAGGQGTDSDGADTVKPGRGQLCRGYKVPVF